MRALGRFGAPCSYPVVERLRLTTQGSARNIRPSPSTPSAMKPTATPVPRHITVGLPVTYCIGSDRYAMHVHAIERGGLTLICAHGTPADEASRVAQVTERCTGRDNSTIDWQIKQGRRAFTRRADQTYRSKGPHGSGALWFGEAEDYLDPSF